MLLKVLKYDIFYNGTVCGRKVPPPPKVVSPVALFEPWELAEQFEGGSPLNPAHQVADRQLWRDRHKDMDVVG